MMRVAGLRIVRGPSRLPFLLAVLAAFGLAPEGLAQGPDGLPVTIPQAERFDLRARSGLEYRVFVASPSRPAPGAGFPVIYLTDGNTDFPILLAAAQRQSREGLQAVVVGIGYPTDDPLVQRDRRVFDLTPPTSEEWMKDKARAMGPIKTGGDRAFLAFIEDELKPFIEGRYKIDRARQTLFGHSFGGLFVLRSLFGRPDAFRTYVASSPSLWWNDGSALADAKEFLERLPAGKVAARVFVSAGQWEDRPPPGAPGGPRPGPASERLPMIGTAKDLVARLNAAGLSAEFREFAEENHGTAVLPAASLGVRFALRDAKPAEAPPRPAQQSRALRLPETPFAYGRDDLPAHFRTPAARSLDSTPAANPITDWGATLGRVLFYDARLSANGSISCASCHQQERAFADSRRFPTGHEGAAADRNGMSLVNLRFTKAGFFWDIRAAALEEQVLTPIQSRVEMGSRLDDLVGVLEKDDRYPPLFGKAFGDPEITAGRVAKALAQFVRSMVSYRSKYDKGLAAVDSAAKDFPNFTADENLGKTIFLEKCAICHTDGRGSQAAYFSTFTALNNGIDRTGSEPDAGLGDATLIPSDAGLFKPSDLRNVEHTAPYMHDGRFETLEEVVEHYSGGVNRHPNVSGFIFRMRFTDRQKAAVVAFLKTLSDEAFLTDPRFSDPWGDEGSPAAGPTIERTAATAATPPLATPPPAPLTATERSERLARRQGLPMGEALLWLRSLDADGDGALGRDEAAPLAKLLLQTGSPPRFDRRRFAAGSLRIARGGEAPPAIMVYDKDGDGRLERAELPEPRRRLIDVGDLDGDDALSVDEARTVETVERFIALQANDRDRTRVDRLVQSIGLARDGQGALKGALQKAKDDHERRSAARDAELIARLEATLGTDAFAAFQLAMLAEQDSRDLARGGAPSVDSALDRVFEFDADRDGRLDSGEQEALASVLDETPGGFGAERGPLPGVSRFVERMAARDRNGDGLISADEIPDRMLAVLTPADADRDGALSRRELEGFLRKTGFDRLVVEGLYAGGGFINAFNRSSRLLKGLDLPPDAHREAAALLDAHDRSIRDAVAEAVDVACRMVRDARRDRAGATPTTSP